VWIRRRESERTESKLPRSTFSFLKYTRVSAVGVLERWASSRRRVSSALRALRVVKIIVRDWDFG
jgi:hypothetical protein